MAMLTEVQSQVAKLRLKIVRLDSLIEKYQTDRSLGTESWRQGMVKGFQRDREELARTIKELGG